MKPQKLIDFEIIRLFINGTDEDRRTISKLYPEIDFMSMRDEMMYSLFREHQQRPNIVYPCNFKGRHLRFCITIIEDDRS